MRLTKADKHEPIFTPSLVSRALLEQQKAYNVARSLIPPIPPRKLHWWERVAQWLNARRNEEDDDYDSDY